MEFTYRGKHFMLFAKRYMFKKLCINREGSFVVKESTNKG